MPPAHHGVRQQVELRGRLIEESVNERHRNLGGRPGDGPRVGGDRRDPAGPEAASISGPWIHPSSLQSGIIDHPLIAYLNRLAREVLQLVLPISHALSR